MGQCTFDMVSCGIEDVRALCERYHGYESAGGRATYAWAVKESGLVVAAYAWQPPAFGAAKAVSPGEPQGALALSRMVAVPRKERALRHVSKPLRRQIRLIDRTRYPVLVTYSDEGQGHDGYVYKCAGFTPTARAKRPFYVDSNGARVSSYSNGKTSRGAHARGGDTWIQRWEHRVCGIGKEREWMLDHGWRRFAIHGKTWASGSPAHRWEKS